MCCWTVKSWLFPEDKWVSGTSKTIHSKYFAKNNTTDKIFFKIDINGNKRTKRI